MSESSKAHKANSTKALTFAVFICSTSRYEAMEKGEILTDVAGEIIENLLKNTGHNLAFRRVISDEKIMIEHATKSVLSNPEIDAAIFCGGTGITSLDITIETVSPFFEKSLPGFGEFFRRLSFDKLGTAAVLSRATAGVSKGKAIFCIPGSPDAARLAVELLISPEVAHIVKHARE